LLEECGAPYKIEIFKRQPNQLAPPELKKIHPLGKSPVIGINAPGLAKPIVIAESGTITQYLAEHFAPRLIPTRYPPGKEGQVGMETEGYLRYQFFIQYAEGTLMSLMLANILMSGKTLPGNSCT
jgi:glutathione S-transferase